MSASCTIMRGLRAVAGSWKTTEMLRPSSRRSAAERPSGRPLKMTSPEVIGCSPTMTRAVVDCHSPTPHESSVSPRLTDSETLLTA